MVRGHYGEFKVLVDGVTVIDGGALAALGVLPSGRRIVEVVRQRLSGTPTSRVSDDADPSP
jgi:hypothetical protein